MSKSKMSHSSKIALVVLGSFFLTPVEGRAISKATCLQAQQVINKSFCNNPNLPDMSALDCIDLCLKTPGNDYETAANKWCPQACVDNIPRDNS